MLTPSIVEPASLLGSPLVLWRGSIGNLELRLNLETLVRGCEVLPHSIGNKLCPFRLSHGVCRGRGQCMEQYCFCTDLRLLVSYHIMALRIRRR
jgi:hypothetical protein